MDRPTLNALLGPFPATIDPEFQVLEGTDMGDYVRHRVDYRVEQADGRVPAFLLVPKEMRVPRTGIVAYHQHVGQWDLGKSEGVGLAGDPDQADALELVQHGYVVLAPDAIGFEAGGTSTSAGDVPAR